ncbi:MAG: hypothetical protein B6D71_08400 [gamma proteobacterium symbiont of Stewartia floridana]|nr:MAG: hypothetical protein B6D71_08400 [gamma proteobacterium symbiont of Stewartia floridana]
MFTNRSKSIEHHSCHKRFLFCYNELHKAVMKLKYSRQAYTPQHQGISHNHPKVSPDELPSKMDSMWYRVVVLHFLIVRILSYKTGLLIMPFPVVGVTRPNFLILTPICVSLGVGSALLSGFPITWGVVGIVLLGALMAHVSVNALNEYFDFHSGLDAKTDRTPFSGGSGTLIIQPHLAPQALIIGAISLLITLACGLYLIQVSGWGLIPIGLIGILIIITYTSWINRYRFLVLIASGFCFGPLMVIGTHYALTSQLSIAALLLSLTPFFLVNNLLLLNQIPDIDADRSIGRNNYAISWQAPKRARLFLAFSLAAYVAIVSGVMLGHLPMTALLCLLTIGLVYKIYVVIKRETSDRDQLIASLGRNVILTLLTPSLIFIGILMDTL